MKFRVRAQNDKGLTFQFVVENPNWNGLQNVAETRLAILVASDDLHQKNGPWTVSNIDETA